jgi:hypothetical protein
MRFAALLVDRLYDAAAATADDDQDGLWAARLMLWMQSEHQPEGQPPSEPEHDDIQPRQRISFLRWHQCSMESTHQADDECGGRLQTSGARRSVGSPPWALAAGGGTLWSIRCSVQLLAAAARGIGDPPPRSEVPQAVRRNHLRPQPFAASRESAATPALRRLSRRSRRASRSCAPPAVNQLWLANDHRP